MSTLAEIEAAVEQLPPPEQQTLLAHLTEKLATCLPDGDTSEVRRERWLQKLDQLRTRGSTGQTVVPLQNLFDDLRTEQEA